MTPHTHALHALRASSSPTLRAIMDDTQPARVRLRTMAVQLNGALDADCIDKIELRGLVFAMEAVADQLGEEARALPPPRRRRWWPFG